MDRRVLDYPAGIKPYDWLLIIGLMLAPMTGFRIWKVGPAEVLCLVWSLRHYPTRYIDTKSDVFRFFVFFLAAMAVGSVWGLIVAPEEVHMMQWPTWIYLAYFALALYTGLKKNTTEYNEKILNVFSIMSAVWYLILYFYSIFISKTFFGAPLWFSGVRFTGGATNPHQIAVLMCGLTFCFARNAILRKKPVINLVYAYICIFIILQTESSTGIAAIVLGVISIIYVMTVHSTMSMDKKMLLTAVEAFILIICCILFFDDIYNYIMDWIMSDKNGMGRINLFTQIGGTILKSPLFGLGPGVHAVSQKGRLMEYHSTYTEIIATTGIVGFSVFLWFSMKTFRNILYDDLYLPAIVAIYVYGLGGFAMRRLAYWVIFIFIFVITEKKREQLVNELMSNSYPEYLEAGRVYQKSRSRE